MRFFWNNQTSIYHLQQEINRLKNEFDTLQRNVSIVKPNIDEATRDINLLKIEFGELQRSVSEVKPTIDETNKETAHEIELRAKNRELEIKKANKEIAETEREIADARGKFLERPTLISSLVILLLIMILGLLWSPMLKDALSSRPDPKSVQMAYEELSDLQIRILKLQQKDSGDKTRDDKIKELLVRVKTLETAKPKIDISVKNDN